MGLLDSILGSALGGSEGQGGARDPKVALLIGLVTMLMSRQGGAAQGGGDGGGLLGSLGSILGGAGGGAASGGLGGVLGDLLGGAAGGAGQAAPGVEAGSLGGLGGLFQMLQNAGLGDALNSWIGAGPNQSVSATKVLSLELCGRVLTVKKNFLLRLCASLMPCSRMSSLANSLLRARRE